MTARKPNPHDWHDRPEGTGGRCMTCNCPSKYALYNHRATTREEGAFRA